ncbi:MAG: hypothetical protein CO012_08515 [Syntrophobacterales bacterium CG_4_8_14_3_um_filter_49_14]|nr:MAG: hypothetical protein CO012_08515 [Syntrophobacterales bacterium CG_4_8_14_3_um_filter_49_14]
MPSSFSDKVEKLISILRVLVPWWLPEQLCPWKATSEMGVQLVGQDAHDAIFEFPESHRPFELDHAAWKEQPQDVPPQDDTIEAIVFELDIW